ncbi:MAG: outer membrane beta-barrel protein [Ferruginibacter sp.]
MKKYLILVPLLFSAFFCSAQTNTKTVPYEGTEYEEGATRTITKSSDESLRKVYTIEIKNKNGIVQSRRVFVKGWEGELDVTVETFEFKRSKLVSTVKSKLKFNSEGKLTDFETNSDGVNNTYSRSDNGGLKKNNDSEDDPVLDKRWVNCVEKGHEEKSLWLDKLFEDDTISPPESEKSSCLPTAARTQTCQNKLNVFVGPSILWGDVGQDKEILFGGHAYALYNINAHIGAGLDYSTHCKKNDAQKITRSFLMARGQYTFGNFGTFGEKYCKHKVFPEAHVVIGLAYESIKYTFNGNTTKNSGNGFVVGAGAGIGIKLSNKINFSVTGDYLAVKFKNNDDINSNVRVSAGLSVGLFSKKTGDDNFDDAIYHSFYF